MIIMENQIVRPGLDTYLQLSHWDSLQYYFLQSFFTIFTILIFPNPDYPLCQLYIILLFPYPGYIWHI